MYYTTMICELISFLVPWTPTPEPIAGLSFLAILVLGGLFAATPFNPTRARRPLGLPTIAVAYVLDVLISNGIVASNGLEIDRFPSGVEMVMYAFIAGGWLIGAAIGGGVLALRRRRNRVDATGRRRAVTPPRRPRSRRPQVFE